MLLSNVDFFTTQKLLGRKINVKFNNLSTSCLVFIGNEERISIYNYITLFLQRIIRTSLMKFLKKKLISDPTIYINISSKMEKSHAPLGSENWFVMINLPADVKSMNSDIIKKLRELVILKISAFLKINIEPLIAVEEMLTPIDVQKRTGAYQGSLYGENQNSFLAIVNRKKIETKNGKNCIMLGVRLDQVVAYRWQQISLNTARLIIKNES